MVLCIKQCCLGEIEQNTDQKGSRQTAAITQAAAADPTADVGTDKSGLEVQKIRAGQVF